jgi:hypothetical protein
VDPISNVQGTGVCLQRCADAGLRITNRLTMLL